MPASSDRPFCARAAAMAFDHRMDELHDHDGLTDTRAAEHRGFASLQKRGEEVDDLDAGFEYGSGLTALSQRRRGPVNGSVRHVGGQRRAAVAGGSGNVEQATEHRVTDRHRDRTSASAHRHAASEPGGCLQRNPAHRALVDMSLNLDDQAFRLIPFDDEGFVQPWQFCRLEGDVNHRPTYCDDPS